MEAALFNKTLTTLYSEPATSHSEDGVIKSTIEDEGLYGCAVRVLSREDGWAHIITHYGYTGYVKNESLMFLTEEELIERSARDLRVVDVICLDVMSRPSVDAVRMAHLLGGSVIEALPGESERPGWQKVCLNDGTEGYLREQFLEEKRFTEDLLWEDPDVAAAEQQGAAENRFTALGGRDGFSLQEVLDRYYGGKEDAFRTQLITEAEKYLGVQYRWGGKTQMGIDCSGMASMAYMRCGVLIYRDAVIVDGYPVKRLWSRKEDETLAGEYWTAWRKGDLLYFPGHVAMYLGDGRYIHSTGHIGSGGVVINSLRESDPDFRPDLPEILKSVGGVRTEESA